MSTENSTIMAENIQRYMNIKGVSAQDICNELNIAPTTFSDWRNGRTYPRISKIEILAKYFGCTKADLVEPKEKIDAMRQEVSDEARLLNDEDLTILRKYRQLNAIGKTKLIERLDELNVLGYVKKNQ
ncbi:MAG: helix-turn-helix domain-containing protein [Lachnospiraceae bacterium]|nr:helix-turn-helix domain-containing protein [Lachnospiraceae bacterium]